MFRWADPKPEETKIQPAPPPDPRLAMLKWFSTAHLRDDLVEVVSHFAIMARWMVSNISAGEEATLAMRKLIEAKDWAVRAVIVEKNDPAGTAATGSGTTTTMEEPPAQRRKEGPDG